MKRRRIFVIIFFTLYLIILTACSEAPEEKNICTGDCRIICSPESECCYKTNCIPSDCQDGKDVPYYLDKGYVMKNIEHFEWGSCEEELKD